MGRRSIIREFQVLEDSDSATNPDSTHTDVSSVDFITYRLSVDASVSASAQVKFVNADTFDASQAKALNFGETLSLVGATDTDYMIEIENKGFKWMYLDITNNAGTGEINAWITGTTRGA